MENDENDDLLLRCNSTVCNQNTPDCHCSGEETIISDLDARPQIVYLTFDDGFTALAEEQFYRELFNGTYRQSGDCSGQTFQLRHNSDGGQAQKESILGGIIILLTPAPITDPFSAWKPHILVP